MMLGRFFNLLYVVCGVWITILIVAFQGLSHVLSPQIVVILMFGPLAIVLGLRYLAGPYAD